MGLEMAATIYWKKDDPDEFQVRDVNVPGVFPKPSTKVNQDSVFASAKPWLLQRNMEHQNKDPSRPRPKSAAGSGKSGERRNANKMTTRRENERIQHLGTDRSKLQSISDKHMRMSANLKDLCSEDKKRITNLIKELAKAGEERKTAVGALHKERLSFKDKEDLLIQEQENLAMERDELKEKILEYQFLINQYNKQIRDEKDVFERAEPRKKGGLQAASAYSRFANESGIHAQLNDPSNIKPPLSPNESRLERIPTYYSIPENTKDKLPQAHEGNIATKNMTGSDEFVANVYTGSQNFAVESPTEIQRDSTVMPKAASSTPESKLPRSEKSWDGQVTLNQSHNSSVDKLAMDKMQLEIQQNLLEQQHKLLQQQIQIQEQLESLQEVQKKYADELSHLPKQRQKITDPENQIKNLQHLSTSEEEVKQTMKRNNSETVVRFGKSSRENFIYKKSPAREARPDEMHPLNGNEKPNAYQIDQRSLIEEPDEHDVDNSPGFSLHRQQSPSLSSCVREPKRPQSRHTETPAFTAPRMQAYHGHEHSRISSNKNYHKKKIMHHQSFDYVNQESGSAASEIESNINGDLNQQATPFQTQKSHLRQTPSYYLQEDNSGTHLSYRTPHKSPSKSMSLPKQQQRHKATAEAVRHPAREARSDEMHPLNGNEKPNAYQFDQRSSIEEPDEHAIDKSPGFSLHRQRSPSLSSCMREPKRPQSRHTETPAFTAPRMQAYHGHEHSRISSNKNYYKKKIKHHQSFDYVNQESGSAASEIESNIYGDLNQQAAPFQTQKSHLRQTPSHYLKEDNSGTHLSYRTPHKSPSKSMSLPKQQQRHYDTLKQTSLLNMLDTLDTQSNSDDNGDFDLGSYLGFSNKLLKGQYSNEKLFASTEHSDEENSLDDTELLEDIFFLKKFKHPF